MLGAHIAHKITGVGHFPAFTKGGNRLDDMGVADISLSLDACRNGGDFHTFIGQACQTALDRYSIEASATLTEQLYRNARR